MKTETIQSKSEMTVGTMVAKLSLFALGCISFCYFITVTLRSLAELLS